MLAVSSAAMSFGPTVALAIALWIVISYTSIFLHEAGHAIAALAMRIPLRSIEVGKRKRLGTLRIGWVDLTFRLAPTGGLTRLNVPPTRGRYIVFALGGLSVNLLLTAAGCLLIRSFGLVAVLVALVNATMLLGNALPLPANPPRRPRPSDGWTVLALIFRPTKVLPPKTVLPPMLAMKLKQWKHHEDR